MAGSSTSGSSSSGSSRTSSSSSSRRVTSSRRTSSSNATRSGSTSGRSSSGTTSSSTSTRSTIDRLNKRIQSSRTSTPSQETCTGPSCRRGRSSNSSSYSQSPTYSSSGETCTGPFCQRGGSGNSYSYSRAPALTPEQRSENLQPNSDGSDKYFHPYQSSDNKMDNIRFSLPQGQVQFGFSGERDGTKTSGDGFTLQDNSHINSDPAQNKYWQKELKLNGIGTISREWDKEKKVWTYNVELDKSFKGNFDISVGGKNYGINTNDLANRLKNQAGPAATQPAAAPASKGAPAGAASAGAAPPASEKTPTVPAGTPTSSGAKVEPEKDPKTGEKLGVVPKSPPNSSPAESNTPAALAKKFGDLLNNPQYNLRRNELKNMFSSGFSNPSELKKSNDALVEMIKKYNDRPEEHYKKFVKDLRGFHTSINQYLESLNKPRSAPKPMDTSTTTAPVKSIPAATTTETQPATRPATPPSSTPPLTSVATPQAGAQTSALPPSDKAVAQTSPTNNPPTIIHSNTPSKVQEAFKNAKPEELTTLDKTKYWSIGNVPFHKGKNGEIFYRTQNDGWRSLSDPNRRFHEIGGKEIIEDTSPTPPQRQPAGATSTGAPPASAVTTGARSAAPPQAEKASAAAEKATTAGATSQASPTSSGATSTGGTASRQTPRTHDSPIVEINDDTLKKIIGNGRWILLEVGKAKCPGCDSIKGILQKATVGKDIDVYTVQGFNEHWQETNPTIVNKYNIDATPTTILINPKGEAVGRVTGGDRSDIDKLLAKISQ